MVTKVMPAPTSAPRSPTPTNPTPSNPSPSSAPVREPQIPLTDLRGDPISETVRLSSAVEAVEAEGQLGVGAYRDLDGLRCVVGIIEDIDKNYKRQRRIELGSGFLNAVITANDGYAGSPAGRCLYMADWLRDNAAKYLEAS